MCFVALCCIYFRLLFRECLYQFNGFGNVYADWTTKCHCICTGSFIYFLFSFSFSLRINNSSTKVSTLWRMKSMKKETYSYWSCCSQKYTHFCDKGWIRAVKMIIFAIAAIAAVFKYVHALRSFLEHKNVDVLKWFSPMHSVNQHSFI